MSAAICKHCSCQIVFGHDVDSGKVIPLDNMLSVFQIVGGENVKLVSGYRARHRCLPAALPVPEPSFTEPKELPWSASE